MIRRLACFMLLLAAVMGISIRETPSYAHDDDPLISAAPAPDSEVRELRQIQLQFGERVSGIQIRLVGSNTYELSVIRADDQQSAIGVVPNDLPDGRYQVLWQATTSDEHSISGTYSFIYKSDARISGWQWASGIAAFVVAGIVFWLWQRSQRSAKLLAEGKP